MTIVRNTILDDKDYLEKLNNLIVKYDLKDNIKIKPDVPFDERTKIKYIYPPYLKRIFLDNQ
jgi:hypothetical protein